MKHMLRQYFALITDDEFLKIGKLTEGYTNGDLAIVALKVMDKKVSEKSSSKHFSKCPFRSKTSQSVFTPCGPFEEKKLPLKPGQIAAVGPKVEVAPLTFEDVKEQISVFKKSVDKTLIDQHLAYSKDHSYKPPDTSNVVKFVRS